MTFIALLLHNRDYTDADFDISAIENSHVFINRVHALHNVVLNDKIIHGRTRACTEKNYSAAGHGLLKIVVATKMRVY